MKFLYCHFFAANLIRTVGQDSTHHASAHTAATCAVGYNICCVEAQGSQSSEAFQQAGQKAAAAFAHYESTPQPQTVQQGQEPHALLAALGSDQSAACAPQQCVAYDEDFQACAL